jgi:hypothetical protein
MRHSHAKVRENRAAFNAVLIVEELLKQNSTAKTIQIVKAGIQETDSCLFAFPIPSWPSLRLGGFHHGVLSR